MQTVSKLMEQGDHIVMRQKGWIAIDAVCKVADQVGYGCLKLLGVGAQPSGANVVHPSATAFASASRWIQIKLTDQLAVSFNAVEGNGRVPYGCLVRSDIDFKQCLNDFEEPLQNLGCCEVLFDFLLAEAVAGFFELFTNVGPVPRLRIFQI